MTIYDDGFDVGPFCITDLDSGKLDRIFSAIAQGIDECRPVVQNKDP